MISWARTGIDAFAACALACAALLVQRGDVAPLQPSPVPLPEKVVLPAAFAVEKWSEGGIPTIVVSINESRLERAVVATGLNANVVSPATQQRLQLKSVEGKVRVDVLDASTTAVQTEVDRFRAATLDIPKMAFAVADVPGMLSSHSRPDSPAAWLGTPFLSAFQMTIEPGAANITLNKQTAALPRSHETAVEKLVFRDNRPYVKVTVPGAPSFLALIDTASPGTVIPAEVGEKLKVKPIGLHPITFHDGKTGKAAFVELPRLTVGRAEWKAARVYYLSSESGASYDRKFAVIGMDFLSRYKVTLDFKRAQIALTPPAAPDSASGSSQ